MRRHLVLVFWVTGSVGLLSGVAEGALITFGFAGQITSVSDPQGVLGGAVAVGQSYSGTYSFDSETPDLYPGLLENGRYACTLNGLSVLLGSLPLVIPESFVSVGDHLRGDFYGVGTGKQLSGAWRVAEFGVTMHENTGSVFANDSLPLTVPDLNLFPTRSLWVQLGPTSGLEAIIQGTVTSWIPEPGTLLLAAAGTITATTRRRAIVRCGVDRI